MSHLSINVLGNLLVTMDNKPITKLESVKVRALLAYLAVEKDSPQRREKLMGLLWPDYPEESARHNLRQALFNLRSGLSDQAANPHYLIITRDSVQLNHESDFSLDLDLFNRHFFICKENLNNYDKDYPVHAAHLEEMVKLYRGEFLQQFFLADSTEFEEWAVLQRESVHQRVMEAHWHLANYYELLCDYSNANLHAQHQLELDPWREEAHCQMMRALALNGERTAALAQYDTCKRVLAEELDVEPSEVTRKLYDQIKLGTLKPRGGEPASLAPAQIKNLPVFLTPFIGRNVELAQLTHLIDDPDCRCITLVGPGGIGKTRLAVQAAESHFSSFSNGVAFVPLASVGSEGGVIPAIANAVNIAFYGPDDPKTQLLTYLTTKQMLLIVDNIEHLLLPDEHQENITRLVVEIMQAAPHVKLLVTSREALNLQGEWLFEVPGLTFPGSDRSEGYDDYDAVALFVQRARRVSSNFTLNETNRLEVARICRLVEGMPLAIELASTWMRTLSPTEIASEIAESLDFLSTTARDIPERHRSIRVVFDHSWQMLTMEEQQVLSKLSIFRGGFQRQAAEPVAGATLSILATLVNRTLLRRTSAGRYDLHELVRQYCANRLEEDSQAKSIALKNHCEFYLKFAETANLELQRRDQMEWLSLLEQEHDNLRVALEWTLNEGCEATDGDEPALRLSSALRWYWRMRGHFHEGCDWLRETLNRYPERHTEARASALLALSMLLNGLGDLGAACSPVEQSVTIFQELGYQPGLAEALMVAGLTSLWQGDAAQGHDRTWQALEIYRKLGDHWGEAQALYRLGSYLADYGGAPVGKTMLEDSAAILESFGEKYLYTSVLVSLGIVDMKLGEYEMAQIRFEHGLEASREIKHPWGIADVLTNLGCLSRIRGDFTKAQNYLEAALRVYQERGRNVWQTDAHCALTENAIVQGDLTVARTHLEAATSLLGSSENKLLQVLVGYFRGLLAYYEGKIVEADSSLAETVALSRTGYFKPDLARSLVALGWVRLSQGETEHARELIREGLGVYWDISHKLGFSISLEALGCVSVAQGLELEAVRLFSTAANLRRELGAPLPPIDRPTNDMAICQCRARLDESVFTEIWNQAATKPVEDLVCEILGLK